MHTTRRWRYWTVCSLFLLAVVLLVNTYGVISAQVSSFSFGAAGDIGGSSDAAAVLQSIGKSGLDFFIVLGDLSYADPQPESAWCDYVKTNVGNTSFPFEIISGNHEDDGPPGNNINNFAQCLPHRAGTIQGAYAKEYYLDYPPSTPLARIILISPNLTIDGTKYSFAKGTSRYNWLSTTINEARSRAIPWVVVGMHENCISMGDKSCSISIDLFNLLVEKKVDLVLQGHDHNYQRSKQFAMGSSCSALVANTHTPSCVVDDGADGVYTKGAGTLMVIAGTGGKGLYNIAPGDSEAGYFAKSMGANSNARKGFVKYTLSAQQLTAQFIGATAGSFTDSFTIQNSGPIVSISPSPTGVPCHLKQTGDALCNGSIDLADFEQWRKEYRNDLTTKKADFNNSGMIELVDFEIWRTGYYIATTLRP